MSKSMMRAPGGTCHHDQIEVSSLQKRGATLPGEVTDLLLCMALCMRYRVRTHQWCCACIMMIKRVLTRSVMRLP